MKGTSLGTKEGLGLLRIPINYMKGTSLGTKEGLGLRIPINYMKGILGR
jgi:hypothetical protein